MRGFRGWIRTVGTGLVAAAALTTGCGSAGPPGSVYGRPGVWIDEPVYSFGSARVGDVVSHRFPVHNLGDHNLELDDIEADCQCKGRIAAADFVAPGEVGAIDVSFDTSGRSGTTVAAVEVATNDPLQPRIKLVLQGEVIADVAVEPEHLFFGRVRRNQERSLEVAVRPLRRSVSIERIRARSRRARFRVEPIDDSDGVRVRVTLPPQSRPGRVSDWIVIETSSKRQPRIEIPILASIE